MCAGAFVAFMAGWVAAFFVHPWPHRLGPAMSAVAGVAMASALLYHVANRSFAEPIEQPVHREIETPTTVSNLVRWNWIGPLFAWIVFNLGSFAILSDQLHLRTVATVVVSLVVGTGLCWLFVFAHARGWIHDE